ncbi:mechanosensitive ion channel family protein [Flavobacterium frigoris]|uniref:Potassium efflux system KefA protein / Small-conductance mechanosensitive channel n=1 Tax=Flavobacterium frigoris (strain PS1) TaxID=1086011 RepID=H7FTP2_FLAFP|nr:mechanosensitive ion channel family protein [Flavobacterium frigoris]EIA08521.1 potassium efflux system KefA protein / Small-conductance mechanosensitive channel [Flavobacterium frigoris PS1]
MNAFFLDNKESIVYGLIVVMVVSALVIITNAAHNWLAKKALKKYPTEEPETIHLIKKILRTLWIILGISAISFIFIEKSYYAQATQNFWLLFYLGFVIILTIISASIVQTLFARTIKRKLKNQEDPTSHKFLRYLAIVGIYFFGIVLAILAFPSLRGIAQTALGGAGVLAVIAGVASQEAFANIVGGIFIIIFKPFKINDIIKISQELVGNVTEITLRHTIIKNYENKMIVIPNAIINKEKVVNYDLGDKKCCQWIEIAISYDSDIDLAKEIMRSECESHPNLIEYRTLLEIKNKDPKVIVRVVKLADSAVVIRAWAWAKDYPSAFVMKCELYESIKKRFDREGIEIPFPHQTIVFKTPSILNPDNNNE